MKRIKIPSIVRQKVFCKYYKLNNYKCIICKIHYINPFNFHIAHIKSLNKGGDNNISNLIPTCPSCNLSCHTKNINELKKLLK